jgi:hypothetical protein
VSKVVHDDNLNGFFPFFASLNIDDSEVISAVVLTIFNA